MPRLRARAGELDDLTSDGEAYRAAFLVVAAARRPRAGTGPHSGSGDRRSRRRRCRSVYCHRSDCAGRAALQDRDVDAIRFARIGGNTVSSGSGPWRGQRDLSARRALESHIRNYAILWDAGIYVWWNNNTNAFSFLESPTGGGIQVFSQTQTVASYFSGLYPSGGVSGFPPADYTNVPLVPQTQTGTLNVGPDFKRRDQRAGERLRRRAVYFSGERPLRRCLADLLRKRQRRCHGTDRSIRRRGHAGRNWKRNSVGR